MKRYNRQLINISKCGNFAKLKIKLDTPKIFSNSNTKIQPAKMCTYSRKIIKKHDKKFLNILKFKRFDKIESSIQFEVRSRQSSRIQKFDKIPEKCYSRLGSFRES